MTHPTLKPHISADTNIPELTIKAVILGLILATVLALSNTFLALKIGMLTASSIPASILSMGILRFFRQHTILENNLVQTCASAGEAIAGGIVYTAPALIIVHYWMNFNYWNTFFIALIGGSLGVFFTIPLRKAYMHDRHLRFPEGTAIAEILKMKATNLGHFTRLLIGSALGAIIELCQTGFKVLANNVQYWVTKAGITTGFGLGFSATLIGAGYIMGYEVGISVLIGTIIANVFSVAILSHLYPANLPLSSASAIAADLLSNKVRYMGIGAMLVSALWTLLYLLKPLFTGLMVSIKGLTQNSFTSQTTLRTERDMPLAYVITMIGVLLIGTYFLLNHLFDLSSFTINPHFHPAYLIGCLIYIVILGFIFSAVCGYFSGLLGVAPSPGSAIAIATILIAALLCRFLLHLHTGIADSLMKEAEAITIVLASIVMGSAAVANNNSQDLKVGQIVGATPWKQQLMLLLGGLVAALIIPLAMQLLYQTYGIANVVPHANMDPNQSLPAPPAAAIAAITQGIFHSNLPWSLMIAGGAIALLAIILSLILQRYSRFKLSAIAIAIGIYLPLATSSTLVLGALINYIVTRKLQRRKSDEQSSYNGIILACGLVAGAALMNVVLAVPLSMLHNPDSLVLLPAHLYPLSEILGAITTAGLAYYLYRVATK